MMRLPDVAPNRVTRPVPHWVRRAAYLFLFALIGTGISASIGPDSAAEAPAGTAASLTAPMPRYAPDGPLIIPSAPVAGVLEITIPPGTAEKMAQGGDGYILPSVIHLTKGDRIVIHNEDGFPHLMLWAFLLPGQSDARTFAEVGSEVYSAGCTIDPTPNGFMSLFVHDTGSL